MAGISIWQLLIIAIIVVLLFGTNKLRTLGSDLGSSIKGFKKALNEEGDKSNVTTSTSSSSTQSDAVASPTAQVTHGND
ncbi:Sec-independent protein translocase subunit TatA [Zooshikella marina]|uniref:Sec-independent protein translocase subunit TatA n=1 Tax=Zooshikella ganghwensis TaxID=202772 RepID=UPI001BAEABBE|nr:Sec-independent protein translocase subunit TatA [Zooshikella ganghwensis]MBU2708442.1 Sec-independent protein translocase subunit TatA [Zooshikella ganghwensis]